MKKYIVFFLSIVLLLGTVLVYNTINVKKEKQLNFSESGYILNSLSDRFYFYKDETYTKSYDDKIVFNDTEGEKITVGQENFLHYSSGSIEALKESVLLDLNNINQNPILYYNIGANKEIKKVSNRYTIKNLKSDIQFDKAIWKISDNKYIVVASNININLSSGITKEVADYVELEYSDNEIVNLYNQETNYQTISSDSIIELPDGIKINLGTKIVIKDDEIKMSLDNMVINSDDNVNIVDLADYEVKKDKEDQDKEDEIEDDQEENAGANAGVIGVQGGNGQSTTTTTNSSTTTISNNGNNGAGGNSNGNAESNEDDEDAEEFDPSEIVYPTNTNETTIDETKPIAEPVFKVDKMTMDATRFETNISIKDEDDVLSKDDEIIYQIRNDSTGKIIRETADVSNMKFSISRENLTPNTQYSLIVSGKYIVDDTAYGKNFIYKTFVTSDIGIELIKDGFTDSSMSFEAIFDDDTLAQSAKVAIFDYYADTSSIDNAKEAKEITKDSRKVVFNNLESNTEYKVKILNVVYNNASTNWSKEYNYTTLKKKASFKANSYTDKKNGNFNLYVENVIDKDKIIQNYEYRLYEIKNDQITDNIVYRSRKDAEQDIVEVCYDETNEAAKVFAGKEYEYALKIVATMYDNEKYIEVEEEGDGQAVLSMPPKEYPTISWTPGDIGATYINGVIVINDTNDSINLNKNIKVEYKNSIENKTTYVNTIYGKDTDGNISIEVNMSNLKAMETYTFDVYATVNIGETDQEGNSVDRENAPIGTIRVTTKKYDPLRSKPRNLKKGNNSQYQSKSFAINLKLNKTEDSSDEALDNLDSLTLILQESDAYSPNNSNTSEKVINQKNLNEYTNQTTSLKEYVSVYGIDITPDLMGISGDTAQNYTIGVTMTKDSTSYNNLIPIQRDISNEDQLPISNEDYVKNGIKYTAVWITVDTSETTTEKEAPFVTEIINGEAGEHKKDNLDFSTVVGYTVTANFKHESRPDRKRIRYYVEDKDGNQISEEYIDYTSEGSSTIPSCKFYFDDNDFARGNRYKFGYDVEYENETQSSIDKTERIAQKQEPVITMYPVSSYVDETKGNTIKYYYSYKDPDSAIIKKEIDGTAYAVIYLDENIYYIIDEGKNQEIKFTDLEKNRSYMVYYNYLLSSEEEVTKKDLGIIKFENIIDISDDDITDYITCSVRNNTSSSSDSEQQTLRINFTKNTDAEINLLPRVAMIDITFKVKDGSGEYTITKGEYSHLLLNRTTDSAKCYIDFDLTSQYTELWELVDGEFQIEYSVYYDTGKIGFNGKLGQNDVTSEWVAYTNQEDYYLNVIDNSWKADVTGNVYYKQATEQAPGIQFNNSEVFANVIDIQDIGRQIKFFYGGSSLVYQSNTVKQKYIKQSSVGTKRVTNTNKIIPAINVTIEEEGTATLEFNITTFNVDKYNDKYDPDVDIVVEVYDNKTDSIVEATVNQNGGEGKYIITELTPKTTYYMKIGYAPGKYFYDKENKQVGYKYYFNTGTGIDVSDASVSYNPVKYGQRYINLSYKIEKGQQDYYNLVTYRFYDVTGNGEKTIEITKQKKNEDNSIYTETEGEKIEINHKIGFGPLNHEDGFIFEFGREYRLDIIPCIKKDLENPDEIPAQLDKNENVLTFTLPTLSNPATGFRFTRIDNEDDSKSIKIIVTVSDSDCVLTSDAYSNGYGIIELKALDENNGQVGLTDVNGNQVTGLVLGSNNTINKTLYMSGNIDLSKTYYLQCVLHINKTNISGQAIDTISKVKIDGISNSAGIDKGTVDTYNTSIDNNHYKTMLRFYDSYHLTSINLIDYTIYEYNNKDITGNGNFWRSGYLKPGSGLNWTNNSGYYGLELPFEFDKDKGYVIVADLYNTNYSEEYSDDFDRILHSKYGDKIQIVSKYN